LGRACGAWLRKRRTTALASSLTWLGVRVGVRVRVRVRVRARVRVRVRVRVGGRVS